MIDFYCRQGPEDSQYIVDCPIIEQIMWDAMLDAVNGLMPSARRHRIKGQYGAEGEEIYYAAYYAECGGKNNEDAELLASKWGYKFGLGNQPIKIEMERKQ